MGLRLTCWWWTCHLHRDTEVSTAACLSSSGFAPGEICSSCTSIHLRLQLIMVVRFWLSFDPQPSCSQRYAKLLREGVGCKICTGAVTVKLNGAEVDPTRYCLEGVYVAATEYCPAAKG